LARRRILVVGNVIELLRNEQNRTMGSVDIWAVSCLRSVSDDEYREVKGQREKWG